MNVRDFFNKEITFNQAYIVNRIYELMLARTRVKKHGSERVFQKGAKRLAPQEITFDFTKHPHLEKHYKMMPQALLDILDPYTTRTKLQMVKDLYQAIKDTDAFIASVTIVLSHLFPTTRKNIILDFKRYPQLKKHYEALPEDIRDILNPLIPTEFSFK